MSVQRVTPTICLAGLDVIISAMFSPFNSGILRLNRIARVLALLPQGIPSKQWAACKTRFERSVKELKLEIPVAVTGRSCGQIMELLPSCFDFIDENSEANSHQACFYSAGYIAPTTTLIIDASEGGNIASVVALAFMVIARHWTLADACLQIKAAHPTAQPDPCLLFQLLAMEKAFKGGQGTIDMKKMISIFHPGIAHEKQQTRPSFLPEVSGYGMNSMTRATTLSINSTSNKEEKRKPRGFGATIREAIFGKVAIANA